MVVNAILWVCRTGCQWRNIDSAYRPHLPIILYYYYAWQRNGTWEKAVNTLREKARKCCGSKPSPSLSAVDSQSVKLAPMIAIARGLDGNKRVNGRKRPGGDPHIVVDKFGYLLAVFVTAASAHDGKAGIELLPQLEGLERLEKTRADKAYRGEFEEAAREFGWSVEIAQKPESVKGFVPQQGRWQVERSFGWLNFYRRLCKDYERTTASAAAFIRIAFINMMLANIHP